MKQGIEKVMDIAEMKLKAGAPVLDKYERAMVLNILRSAIETAFREVRPKESDESPHNGNPMWERKVGYNAALEDLDENMAKYLKK